MNSIVCVTLAEYHAGSPCDDRGLAPEAAMDRLRADIEGSWSTVRVLQEDLALPWNMR